ncbi:hypothetical protein PoB_006746900 [Plakobranchus ocellatus]|uniref:Uncharacterized protein n=1 Tax=Plakobranchus ocellatus TaxID=259542 RepID=A0AAV4D9Z6_9GAST|nr:hypothetical protein PoB_006746900 [Plakobranchus ocellatus]
MVERYVEKHQAVTGALCALGKAEMRVSNDEIHLLKTIINVLTPFDLVTLEMSIEKHPSLSKTLSKVRQVNGNSIKRAALVTQRSLSGGDAEKIHRSIKQRDSLRCKFSRSTI